MVEFTYVDSMDDLYAASEQWMSASEVGIDLECENNLHYYGAYISLIQVSTPERNWIVDVIRLQGIQPVLQMLKDPSIQKIFHDVRFDLGILYHQFNCRPKNIFDTQVAAMLSGEKEIGLCPLLQQFFGIHKEQKFQMADWTRRPLKPDMLKYAINDTLYLIQLRDILKDRLREQGRLSWVEEEFAVIEEKKLDYQRKTYLDIRGIRVLSGGSRAILKRLFSLREQMAKKANRPPYFIIKTSMLYELAANPPKSIAGWKNLSGVHPIVCKHATSFFEEVAQARKDKIPSLPAQRMQHTPQQKKQFQLLCNMRDVVSEELGIKKHLVLSREQMRALISSGSASNLRKWQQNLLANHGFKDMIFT